MSKLEEKLLNPNCLSFQGLKKNKKDFERNILFACHDHQLPNSVANCIILVGSKGCLDKRMTLGQYLSDEKIWVPRKTKY
jgi:hypothetical protein